MLSVDVVDNVDDDDDVGAIEDADVYLIVDNYTSSGLYFITNFAEILKRLQ